MVFTRVALCSIKVEHSALVIIIGISCQSIMVPLTVSHGSYPYIHTYCSEKINENSIGCVELWFISYVNIKTFSSFIQ